MRAERALESAASVCSTAGNPCSKEGSGIPCEDRLPARLRTASEISVARPVRFERSIESNGEVYVEINFAKSAFTQRKPSLLKG